MTRLALRSVWCAALIVAVTASISPSAAGESTKRRRPNVVVIVTDDLGYADLGFQGCKDIPTPHLDALAASGVRLSAAYVTGPICGPSRAAIMSGRYQQRHSYDGNPGPKQGLNVKEITLAAALKGGNYKTGVIGKWHLGSLPEYRPLARGFDEFFGFYGAMHSYVPGQVDPSARMVFERTRKERAAGDKSDPPRPGPKVGGPGEGTGVAPGKLIRGSPARAEGEVDEPGYLTEAFAREAEDFISRHKAEPFFLYVAFNASHSPLQPPQKYLDRFPKLEGKRKAYAATTSALDDAVGRIVAKLRELGLEEDTLLYFTNDNGGPIDDIAASNGRLGGAKFSLWEGGVRVPAFVAWKGTIPGKKVIDLPVSSLDIYPTVLSAVGLDVPKTLDGVNLLPILQGKASGTDLAQRTLYWRFNEFWAIRSGNWKLTYPERGEKVQLFDLAKDPGENNDLSAANPEVAERLTADWRAWDEKNLPATKNASP